MEHKANAKQSNDDSSEKQSQHKGLLGTPNFNIDNDEHTLPKGMQFIDSYNVL